MIEVGDIVRLTPTVVPISAWATPWRDILNENMLLVVKSNDGYMLTLDSLSQRDNWPDISLNLSYENVTKVF